MGLFCTALWMGAAIAQKNPSESGPARSEYAIDPRIQEITAEISEERITATLKHLESFGTRNLLSSDTDPSHGTGAARRWIFLEMQSYSPRLRLRFDTYRVKKQGARLVRNVELNNVVAVLPGMKHPERQILVTGHYDTLAIVKKAASATSKGAVPADPENEPSTTDWEKSAESPIAPGVTDDGSGVAVVMELARVLSQREFDATLVFIAFSGEEEGLIGSSLYAAKAEESAENIEAVLNNDIVGSDVSGDGRRENRRVNLYSAGPEDSSSRAVARLVKEIGERYAPGFHVNLIFRPDRFARGGDHTPFNAAGFAGVRLTSPAEFFDNQHTVTDTFQNTSPAYVTRVARVNAAAAAELALAPAPPAVTRIATTGAQKGHAVPRIARGKSGYDAVLRWAPGEKDVSVQGYAIVMRSTLAPLWEKEIFVGDALEHTFSDLPIDDLIFGVKAIGPGGNASPVSAYVMTPFEVKKIETY